MNKTFLSPVKINLTLRVMSRRPDYFHEVFSLFFKKHGTEGLTIRPIIGENIVDILHTKGIDIEGQNIVLRTLNWARGKGLSIPRLDMELEKCYPTGSGIGAGSGNAAALLEYLRVTYAFAPSALEIAELGADVSFLAQDADLAFVRGKGEILEPLHSSLPLTVVLAFPAWRSGTAEAYRALDDLRADGSAPPISLQDAVTEAVQIFGKLKKKERVGFLPNDFYVLFQDREEYQRAFEMMEEMDALGWGLCGSGSALFAISSDDRCAEAIQRVLQNEKWVQQTDRLE